MPDFHRGLHDVNSPTARFPGGKDIVPNRFPEWRMNVDDRRLFPSRAVEPSRRAPPASCNCGLGHTQNTDQNDGQLAPARSAAGPWPGPASGRAVFVVMALRLGPVAARAHVTPASGAVSAGIEKQPATGCIGTLADA